MNALIFGAGGQDGYYLARLCRERGVNPVGVSRTQGDVHGDVSDTAFVRTCIGEFAPAYVFHVAANSTTAHDALFENHAVISTGTLNILESVYSLHVPARVFIAGSGVQFQNTGARINEATPFEASSSYSVSRIQSVYAARYFRRLGVRAYVGYLFHHESPRRKPSHLSQKIAMAASRILGGSDEALQVGDLSVQKEWTFAGDTASGMLALLGQDRVSEAVIGSGEPHSVREWVEACFSITGLDWRNHVQEIPGFRAEYKTLVSDPAVIMGLGWKPSVGFSDLARMMVDACRRA